MNLGDTVKIDGSGGRIGKIAGFGVIFDDEKKEFAQVAMVELTDSGRFDSPDGKVHIRMMVVQVGNFQIIRLPEAA